jgi:hypothetical protein
MHGTYKCVRMRGAGDEWNIQVCADAGSRGCVEYTSVCGCGEQGMHGTY